jgi:C-terminal processing protease CtpA/Prc
MRLITLVLLLLVTMPSFSQTSIEFVVEKVSQKNTTNIVGLRGSQSPLSWEKSIPLEFDGSSYRIVLEFEKDIQEIEFKFVLDEASEVTWENTQNRTLKLGNQKHLKTINTWNVEPIVDISMLEKIPSKSLLKDYELIETMVLEVHPGTYRYSDSTQIRAALDELKATFQKPLTHGEAYLAMSKVTAAIQCDHTKPGFNNQNKIINSVIHRQKDKLPFTFKWIDNEMIIIHNATNNSALMPGVEVLSINDVSVLDIQKAMLPYIGADGATDGNRLYKMEVNGYDFRYNAFDIFYPLLFPMKDSQLKLVLKYKENLPLMVEVETLTRAERSAILESRNTGFPKNRDEMWSFRVTDKKDREYSANVGILTINSFGLMGWKKMTIDYKAFLAKAFKELKEQKIDNLIIDIRENNGGNDEMKRELFTYFDFDKKAAKIKRQGRTRYLNFPESLKPFVQTWGDNPWFFNLKPDETKEGYYIFNENFSMKGFKQKKDAFKGKIYILMSAANTSLAYYTANDFKRLNIGTLIGQETGGNVNDINGGQILFLRLPHSQIEIDFPVMGGFMIEKQPNQGVKPDFEIKRSKKNYLIDAEMLKAFELIGKE